MSERPKISAVVHTYNSERHLEECLSALEVFDEILVIDMESSDCTVDIANSHGARVIIKERSEHRLPEAYRNFGLQAAKYDWVLLVNDDEIVPMELADYLYDDLERNPEPPCRFFKSYVLKGGFLDGWPGFIHAVHDAIYSFVALSKIQESRETDRSGKNIYRDVAANT